MCACVRVFEWHFPCQYEANALRARVYFRIRQHSLFAFFVKPLVVGRWSLDVGVPRLLDLFFGRRGTFSNENFINKYNGRSRPMN